MVEGKTVLIAGGAGFIGSHLCELFLEKGAKVVCVDNQITGTEKNIAHLKDNPNFTLKEQDITEPFEINEPIHYILNFASPASPKDFPKHPIKILMVGALGTKNLLDLAKKHNAVFLQASTSEVYGDPKISPQVESYWGNVNPIGPRSCYDEAKRFGEALIMAYHRKHNINTKIVRIFNTYGERMRPNDGRVIPNFITQALSNEPITVYGDGTQTRSFCYIKDEIEGFYKLLLSNTNEPVNIGNPKEYTILELANIIKELTNSQSEIIFKELPEDDPKQRRPDITKAKTILNWQPNTELKEGLQKTIEYFKKAKETEQ
jgi:nucleoside-diphosphate-sugar epimerase